MDELQYDVFISYAHEDAHWVGGQLKPRLEGAGLKVCIDVEDFEGGRSIIANFQRAVRLSRKTLLVITPDWIVSEWCCREMLEAIKLDPAAKDGRILPILLKPCKPPKELDFLSFLTSVEGDVQGILIEQVLRDLGSPISRNQPAELRFKIEPVKWEAETREIVVRKLATHLHPNLAKDPWSRAIGRAFGLDGNFEPRAIVADIRRAYTEETKERTEPNQAFTFIETIVQSQNEALTLSFLRSDRDTWPQLWIEGHPTANRGQLKVLRVQKARLWPLKASDVALIGESFEVSAAKRFQIRVLLENVGQLDIDADDRKPRRRPLIYLYLDRNDEGIVASRIHEPESGRNLRPQKWPELIPERLYEADCQAVSLEEIVDALHNSNIAQLNDKLGLALQIRLGEVLFDETLGQFSMEDQARWREKPMDLRIVTQDSWLQSLPWSLMARNCVALTAQQWTIGLSLARPLEFVELPAFPNVLLAMPEKSNEGHQKAIQTQLANFSIVPDEYVKVDPISTWEDFQNKLKQRPDIVYLHCRSLHDGQRAYLLFKKSLEGLFSGLEKVPVQDIAAIMATKKPCKPYILYLDLAEPAEPAWFQDLAAVLPAVIICCTTSLPHVNQLVFRHMLHRLVWHGQSPLEALVDVPIHVYEDLDEPHRPRGFTRWVTPICFAGYRDWTQVSRKIPRLWVDDPDWRVLLDREVQSSAVVYETLEALRRDSPRGLAFLWAASQNHGVEAFHERVCYELREKTGHYAEFKSHELVWPDDPDDLIDSLDEIFCATMGVQSMEHVSGARYFTQEFRQTRGRERLLYLHVRTFNVRNLCDPNHPRWRSDWIEQLLAWCAHHVLQALPRDVRLVMGLSFEVSQPQDTALDLEMLAENYRTRQFQPIVLEPLPQIDSRHLKRFFARHVRGEFPEQNQNELINKILKRSEGKYKEAVEELHRVLTDWSRYLRERLPPASE